MILSIHKTTLLRLASLLVPLTALAQAEEQPGIDLSAPTRPPAQRAEPPAPPPAPPGAKRAAAQEASPPPGVVIEAAPLAIGEGDVAFADRVKAVQRKGFLKRRRLELGVAAPASINDAFFQKLGVTAKLAYNFEDSFALALRGTHYEQIRSTHGREGRQAFQSQLLNSQLHDTLMLDAVWSPVYGKIAWLGSSIVHFDMYLLAGMGAAWSATSAAPRNEGPHIAGDLGAGVRFYPADWLALDGGVVGTFYPDQPSTAVPSTLQKVVTVQVGLSVFFPFRFRYVYP